MEFAGKLRKWVVAKVGEDPFERLFEGIVNSIFQACQTEEWKGLTEKYPWLPGVLLVVAIMTPPALLFGALAQFHFVTASADWFWTRCLLLKWLSSLPGPVQFFGPVAIFVAVLIVYHKLRHAIGARQRWPRLHKFTDNFFLLLFLAAFALVVSLWMLDRNDTRTFWDTLFHDDPEPTWMIVSFLLLPFSLFGVITAGDDEAFEARYSQKRKPTEDSHQPWDNDFREEWLTPHGQAHEASIEEIGKMGLL
jgi:hypothetical protein